ncbi:hypothetical protein Bpla01_29260 [Burkholderia plantarii]|nr:hypothetical protein Bpla01_29260 [Burkholderia plantarii]
MQSKKVSDDTRFHPDHATSFHKKPTQKKPAHRDIAVGRAISVPGAKPRLSRPYCAAGALAASAAGAAGFFMA